MSGYIVRTLLADFIKDLHLAQSFLDDPDGFLSDRGLTLDNAEKAGLKATAEKWAGDINAAGHVDAGSHADIHY